ncbi:hypothetical protein BGX26_004723 [Mortierella sp. AD094]|nr:hypothetical protein BGX26_004723 [Mortierella sp. AD094]
MHSQKFRFNDEDQPQSLQVQQDPNGEFYSRLKNVENIFPGAARFKVNGTFIFLLDKDGNEYEPKRIGYYPDDTIEVLTAVDHSPSGSNTGDTRQEASHYPFHARSPSISPPLTNPSSPLNMSMSHMALESTSSTASPSTSCQSLSKFRFKDDSRTSVSLHSSLPFSSAITRSSSGIYDNITQLQEELANYTDSQSAHNSHVVDQLVQIIQQQAEAKERELEMLRKLVEAREREIAIVQKQVESEERDREHKAMLQQANDRLAILQRSVDAVLVQNYELHEYPIPRPFVILPEKIASQVIEDLEDSKNGTKGLNSAKERQERQRRQEKFLDMIKNLDPRKLLEEKFRLYFLCECGDHSSEDTDTKLSSALTATELIADSKNSVHLALHEGYELSRPTQFLKQYGLYVLGMLQVLKFCLDAAKLVAPAICPAHGTLSKVTDHVKSVSENKLMIAAIDLSMDILQTKLGSDGEFDAMSNNGGDDIFKNLAALEGADLRQLETFLRNKDKDKILGNLYRVTTPEGHVKWVCLEHVRTWYRENAMRSLLNTIDVNRGFYDMQLRKITVTVGYKTVQMF